MATDFYRRKLPHFRVEGSVYFVTWRLRPGQPDLSEAERDLVVSAVRHFDTKRYELHAYVVMNDHVHVLVRPITDHQLADILHSWKSFTAHTMQKQHRRLGTVWQDETFDRIVRDDAEYEQKWSYIYHNPWKRWPEIENYPWVWALGLD